MMRVTKKSVIITSVTAALIIGIVILAFYLRDINEYRSQVHEIQFSEVDVASIPDGRYTGECDVGFIYAKVEVVVQDGAIVTINLLRHDNGRGASAEQVINDMVDRQTTDVDAISGATNSSKVIRKAVENALSGQQ